MFLRLQEESGKGRAVAIESSSYRESRYHYTGHGLLFVRSDAWAQCGGQRHEDDLWIWTSEGHYLNVAALCERQGWAPIERQHLSFIVSVPDGYLS